MNHLDEPLRQEEMTQLFARQEVSLAYLYGSQARGDAGFLSDVDVAVLFAPNVSKPDRFRRLLHLSGELGDMWQRDDVQVVDLAEASPLLRHRVYVDGRVLYCADDAVRVKFILDTMREYEDTRPIRRINEKYTLAYFAD
ncbi:MAG TPA: nucleotidyltransferase domain-containing protein [Chloroflexota bacterium]|nr:nucleotidyltransferase domain-containing protein [Chloroflexota bacterium]